jgi:hypothetical protein
MQVMTQYNADGFVVRHAKYDPRVFTEWYRCTLRVGGNVVVQEAKAQTIKQDDPRYFDPVADKYNNGSRFSRAIQPGHTPTLLESYGKTPASVDASIKRWMGELQDIIDFGNERRVQRKAS